MAPALGGGNLESNPMAHQTTTAPLAWIPLVPAVLAVVDLPLPPENLFGRLIRNPVPVNRPPRERECAEMLAAVLSLAPQVRAALVEWWVGDDLAWDGPEELLFEVGTEAAVPGGKRDDLRIEGRDDDDEPQLLISIEVKVGAGFHRSAAVGAEGGFEDGATGEEELTHQILHYDRWLASEPHSVRKGVVVAPTDRTEGLPTGLRASWRCVTWGQVGRRVADLIEFEGLPPTERFLARHLVGFIQDHLGDITVERDELAFDDVALLRAAARMGRELVRRVDGLVEQAAGMFEEVGVGVGETKRQSNLLSGYMRSIVWRYLYSWDTSLSVSAGIVTEGGVDVVVWVEASSKHPAKAEVQQLVRKHLPVLESADPRWRIPDGGSWKAWWDVEIRSPLERLLAADDQVEELKGFIRGALEQLRDSGLLKDLEITVAGREPGG